MIRRKVLFQQYIVIKDFGEAHLCEHAVEIWVPSQEILVTLIKAFKDRLNGIVKDSFIRFAQRRIIRGRKTVMLFVRPHSRSGNHLSNSIRRNE